MEQWDKEKELDLEDIIKEFSTSDVEDPAPEAATSQPGIPEQVPSAGAADPDEDVMVWNGITAHKEKKASAPQDTVRLDGFIKEKSAQVPATESTIAFTPVTDNTVTFTPVTDNPVASSPVTDNTVAFTPVTDSTIAFTPVNQEPEEETPIFIPPEQPKTEPYSQEWEPEYEDPIGEYEPQEPIVFQPKSRQKELRKKQVAGPEKRYHQLHDRGFGKLLAAIFGCALVSVFSVVTVVLYAVEGVPEERLRLLIFGQLFGLLLSALFGSYQLMEGLGDLLKRRFSLNTLLLFSLVACLTDSILCLEELRVPCCAPFSLNMTMSLWCAYHHRSTELGQMDTLRKARQLNGVVVEEDYYEGRPGILHREGQIEDFMENYRVVSGPTRALNTYALIVLFLSLGIGVVAGIRSGAQIGIRFFSASLLLAAPATAYIATSRPAAILESRFHKMGMVLCGWPGVLAAHVKAAFPVQDTDLFPPGSVKMNGTKFYGSRNPDQVVAYTAAVMAANGGGLAPLFSELLESRNGYHFDVEMLRHYPNGGVGGIVNGEVVLVGSLSFMKEMDVQMPEGAKISYAVYAAIDGVLNGVYALTYDRTKGAALGMTTLCSYRDLKPVMLTEDFMLSEAFIAMMFGVRTRRIAFPEAKQRKELRNRQPHEEAEVVALTSQEGFVSAAYAMTGARALRTATVAGAAVQMMGGILGLLIMMALTAVDAVGLITPQNLLLYELIWLIPGFLITEWSRSV